MLRHCRWAALHFLCLAAVLSLPTSRCACTQSERDSLLSFLSNISTPTDRPLRSWAANTDCCLWEGISCDVDGFVTRLWLPHRGLAGAMPASLDVSLPRLAQVNLSHNRLSGPLPPGLLWSDHIVVLDVSYNLLSGQLLPLPLEEDSETFPNRSRPIRSLNVSSNRFTGELPGLGELAPELRAVNASNNSFTGSIPPWMCSASPRLSVLDLSRNRFGGMVPRGLGNCSELQVLDAGFNNLSGPLPAGLYDATRLHRLSLPYNQLTGVLHGEHMSKLTTLVILDLGGNKLQGEVPGAIGEMTNMEELHLNDNQLNGALPSALSYCTNLRRLNLRGNNLSGDISTVDFSPLSQLRILDLGNNGFTGQLPASIYSCTSLTAVRLSHNTLQGHIPPQMHRLQALSYLSLSGNNLEGIREALQVLSSCRNLTYLLLSFNFNGEAMPDGPQDWPAEAFANLRVLSLWGCQLTGKVPSWIARLGNLHALDLSGNQFTGTIPGWLGYLPKLFYLEMSDNLLSGEVPSQISAMKSLQSDEAAIQVDQSYIELPLFRTSRFLYNRLSDIPSTLNLTNNSLAGTIPPGIGLLQRLHILDLSRNNFSGEIPVQLCNLSNLETLNLSRNHLSGAIPPTLIRLNFLSSFSVAFNDLAGPIPSGGQFSTFPNSSFEGNQGLCGSDVQRPCTNISARDGHRPEDERSLKRKIVVGIVVTIVFGGAFVSIALPLAICKMSSQSSKNIAAAGPAGDVEATSSSSSITGLHHYAVAEGSKVVMLSPANREMENLTLSGILKATNNFHQDNIVGCGSFGLVYKANLPDGSKLAIKRLVGDMGVMEREFAAEVEALSAAQHKNLVSLQGYYVHGSFRLLVYSYMEKGSLDYWLHEADGRGPNSGAVLLDWPARLRIARGASEGLSYIHQICEPHIIHRDIKSSNILLNKQFEAHLADFGLSRLILPHKTHVTTELVGTLGYIPPEYGQAWVATLKGDIYSFGVVLLELLTGRRPIDIFQPRQSEDLVGWVRHMKCRGQHDQVFDPQLRGKGYEEQMSQVLDIACLCVNHNPVKRPTIREVVVRLASLTS